MEHTLVQNNRTSFDLVVDTPSRGDEQCILVTSDIHFDSAACNRDLLYDHLNEGKRRGAVWVDNGDLFDAMQGRGDARSNLNSLRTEYKVDDYYDAIVDDAAAKLAPWGDMMIMTLRGNHETGVLKHNNLDLTSAFAKEMRRRGSGVVGCGYSAFLRARVRRGVAQGSKVIYFHHGPPSSGITKGIPAHKRMMGWCPDADVIVTGHNHADYIIPSERIRLARGGEIGFDLSWMVRVPGYKNAWGGPDGEVGYEGWEVEKAFEPQTQGSAMITIYWKGDRLSCNVEMMRR